MIDRFGNERQEKQVKDQIERIRVLCQEAHKRGNNSARFIWGDSEIIIAVEGFEGLDRLEEEAKNL